MTARDFDFVLNFCPDCGRTSVKQLTPTHYLCSNCKMNFWNNNKTAVAIALVKNNKVLICHSNRDHLKGRAKLPGGYVEHGEDAYNTARREMLEETGVIISGPTLIEVYTAQYTPGLATCDLVFVVTEWQGEPKAQDDIGSLAWKPIDFIDSPDFDWPYNGLSAKLKAFLKNK